MLNAWVAFQNRYNKSIIMGKTLEKNRFGKAFFVDAALYCIDKKYYHILAGKISF